MMIRKPLVQSLAFSSVLAFAAASGAAWAADANQQQSMSSGTSSGQMTQQDATSSGSMGASDQPASSSSGMSSDSQMEQSADASTTSSGNGTGTAIGDDSRTTTGSSTGTEATGEDQQTASISNQNQLGGDADVEPVMNEDELAELSGKTVVNMQDEEIGKVDSIVRDRSDQSLKAVIQSGGFFGIGGEKVAVAADDLQLQDDDTVQLSTPMTKEELQQTASAYEEDNYEPIGSQQASGSQGDQQPSDGSMRSQQG